MQLTLLPSIQNLTALTALLGCVLVGCNRHSSAGDEGTSSKEPRQIYALGRLEPAEGIISISAIPGERLKQIHPDVVENELVPANGILGLLSSFDVGKTQLDALKKQSKLADLKRGHEIEIAKAQLAQAEAGLAQAEAKQKKLELQAGKLSALETASQLAAEEYVLLDELYQSDPELVTLHQMAKQANQIDLASQDFKIANESYSSAKTAAGKAVAAANSNIAVAKLTIQQLDQGYDKQAIEQEIIVAQETLKRSVLLSPHVSAAKLENVAGIECEPDCKSEKPATYGPYTVLKIFVHPGEFVTQTPIVQMGDLSKMVCVAEVYEADVNDVAEKQTVTIRSAAFSDEFADSDIDPETGRKAGGIQGRVTRIGRLIASPGLANRNPLAPADRSVVEVRIEITDTAAIRHAAERVGLSVMVEFGEKPKAGGKGRKEEE